jgi:hypothetical protein
MGGISFEKKEMKQQDAPQFIAGGFWMMSTDMVIALRMAVSGGTTMMRT